MPANQEDPVAIYLREKCKEIVNTHTFCGCENGFCPHEDSACDNVVIRRADGSSEQPVMRWIGAVCPSCAGTMGWSAPENITAPYGTYEFTEARDV